MYKKIIIISASILLLTSCARTDRFDSPVGITDSIVTSAEKNNLTLEGDSDKPGNETENQLDNMLNGEPQIPEPLDWTETGKNTVLASDNLNGFSAELRIRDITSLPSEEDNAYRGSGFSVSVTDEKGKTVTAPLESYCEGAMGNVPGISAECVKNGVAVYRVEQNGKKEYVVVQRGMYNKETGRPMARFLVCDMALYSDDEDVLLPYALAGEAVIREGMYFDISDNFVYVGGTKFADPELGTQIELNIKEHTGTVKPLVFGEPAEGGNAVLAEDSLNGYRASLEIINIRGDIKDKEIIWGGRLQIRLTDPSGKTAFLSLLNGYDTQFGSYFGIPADCIKDAVKIYETEEWGEKSYVVLQRGYRNEKTGRIRARLLSFDFPEDGEVGNEFPEWYRLSQVSPYYPSPVYMYIDITENFVYLGGTSFADAEVGYRIELDTKTRVGKVVFDEV